MRVPTYDNFQTQVALNPEVKVTAPEFQDFKSAQMAKMGAAEQSVGGAALRIFNEANMVRTQDAVNQLERSADSLKFATPDPADPSSGGFLSVKGQSAFERQSGKPLADEYTEKLQSQIDAIGASLGNEQQRQMFKAHANQISTKFYAQAQAHQTDQFATYNESVQTGTVSNARNAILLNPNDPESVKENIDKIDMATSKLTRIKGMSSEQAEATKVDVLANVHGDAIKSLVDGDKTDEAIKYFDEHKDQIQGPKRADIQKLMSAATNSMEAVKSVDEIWGKMGPRGFNDPVNTYKMEQFISEKYADQPAKRKAAIEEIRSRASSFNATQSEFIASNVNAVGKMIVAGKTDAQIRASSSFNALPGDHQVTLLNRSEAERAQAAGPSYLRYSDPDVLSGMTRQQVEALWPQMGQQYTQALVGKWDTLQNKDARLTAKMDNEQFNAIANDFGMDPYDKNRDKAELGQLKARTDMILEQAAKEKRQPLTREEKDDILRKEMAKKVVVNPGWYWPSSEVPVIQLKADDAKNVVVPSEDRSQIVEALQLKYNQTKDSQYAPTEENVRAWYLRKVSPAGKLINVK